MTLRLVQSGRRTNRGKPKRTPIGRVPSANAHVLELQMQFPATGSQNGVEQFAETVAFSRERQRVKRWRERAKRNSVLTAEAGLLADRDLLGRVWILRRWHNLRASVLHHISEEFFNN
jgi:hypothetical protein